MTDPTERQLRELFAADAAGAPDPGGLAALTLHEVRHRRRVRTTAAAGLVAAVVVVGGVATLQDSASPGAGAPSTGADCSFGVRFEGTMFVSEAVVPLPPEPVEQLGEAEVEPCHDTGPLPSGIGFPDETRRRVTVSEYPGYDPRQVLTAPDSEDGVRVLVAADLPPEVRRQTLAALQLTAAD